MLNLFGGILTPIVKGVKDYVMSEQEMKKAEKQNKARLLLDTQSNNHEWEMANLTDKDKWLRRISFAVFVFPMIWAAFDADAVKEYFEVALKVMPEWYIQIVLSMVGGIWGISVLKNSVPALIGGITKAIRK
ncbi:MAG: hypothetical protein CMP14_08465 [Rickettsiales bacterium]|nr:hypothetical protein [Rickettsiales bacterium]|tara:strand:+ start:672 stop:1067 length:396 start_codon:yes stop_codon:yes gene_type:complete